MESSKKRFKWRKWNNILHRDIGYLCVGLIIVYAISGVAVNHRADWNPNYSTTERTVQLEGIDALEPGSDAFAAEVVGQMELTEPVRGTFRRSPVSIDIFLEDALVTVDLTTGVASFEKTSERPVLRETNFLHLNEPKGLWTWVADLFAVALVFMAISGMFMLKGKKGIKGRGAWLTAIGVLIPIIFLLLYR